MWPQPPPPSLFSVQAPLPRAGQSRPLGPRSHAEALRSGSGQHDRLDNVASGHSAASAGLPGCNRSLSRWFLLPVGNSQPLRPGIPARTMHRLGGSRAPFPQPRPPVCGRWQLTLVLALPLPTPPAQCHRPFWAASIQGPTSLFRADGWQGWISMSMGWAAW